MISACGDGDPVIVAKLKRFVIRHRETLTDGKMDFAKTPKHNTTCEITTTQGDPVLREYSKSFAPDDRELIRKTLQEQKDQNIIEPSRAPYANNIVLIKHPKVRVVVDMRELNKQTVRDVYQMPKISDLNDALAGAEWFSAADCCSAYHQIPLADERSKDLTSFSIPGGGLWRFRMMCLGLVNAPAVWSRFIDTALSQYRWDFILTYMDNDILAYTKGHIDKHIDHLELFFDKLDDHGIKLKASKLLLGRKALAWSSARWGFALIR